jgi:hypothetical protein
MWRKISEAHGLNIPEEQLKRIGPVLDGLYRDLRPALDRDLSEVEPIAVFRPAKK